MHIDELFVEKIVKRNLSKRTSKILQHSEAPMLSRRRLRFLKSLDSRFPAQLFLRSLKSTSAVISISMKIGFTADIGSSLLNNFTSPFERNFNFASFNCGSLGFRVEFSFAGGKKFTSESNSAVTRGFQLRSSDKFPDDSLSKNLDLTPWQRSKRCNSHVQLNRI